MNGTLNKKLNGMQSKIYKYKHDAHNIIFLMLVFLPNNLYIYINKYIIYPTLL